MKRFLAVCVSSGLIFLVLWAFRIFHFTESISVLSFVSVGLFLLGAFFLKLFSPSVRVNRFFSLRRMNLLNWRLTITTGLLLIFGSFLLNLLTSSFYSLIGIEAPSAFSVGTSSPGMAVLYVAVLPAMFEELYFRGAVLTSLRAAKMKNWAVIVFSSVLFMLMHGTSWYFLTNFFAGAVLSFLVLLTGSLYSSVAAHFISNAVSYFLSLYSGRIASSAGAGNLTVHIIVVCLLGTLCHLLHLLKKLYLRKEEEDRSGINENSRRWEAKIAKREGEK